jgi:elongation factor P--beta-lysine ligase
MKTWQLLNKNPELWSRYFAKEIVIKSIRKFFEMRKYHELESPILAPMLPQERYLNVIETKEVLNGVNDKFYVIPTTERYNKIALVAGIGNHFVITKVARGAEQLSKNHAIEFTMLEWYEVEHDYFDLMTSVEELILYVKNEIDKFYTEKNIHINIPLTFPSPHYKTGEFLEVNNRIVELTPNWNRFEINELFKNYVGIDLTNFEHNLENLIKHSSHLELNFNGISDFQEGFELIFDKFIQDQIDHSRPYFLYNYPKVMAPLTKKDSSGKFAQKVELYIAGKEIANGYTELTDGNELEANFKVEQQARKKLGLADVNFDHELVEAIKTGMPEVAGIGMGIDRLVMLLTGCNSIADINLFPSNEWLNQT